MASRLLELADELRSEGMAVGTSELLDAFAALEQVTWTAPGPFREALGATLAKSQEDRRVLDLVLDRFLFRATERAAVEQGVTEAPTGADAALADEQADRRPAIRQADLRRAGLLKDVDDTRTLRVGQTAPGLSCTGR